MTAVALSASGSGRSRRSSRSRPAPAEELREALAGMQVDTSQLVLHEVVGRGGFGCVYRGTWRGLNVRCTLSPLRPCMHASVKLQRHVLCLLALRFRELDCFPGSRSASRRFAGCACMLDGRRRCRHRSAYTCISYQTGNTATGRLAISTAAVMPKSCRLQRPPINEGLTPSPPFQIEPGSCSIMAAPCVSLYATIGP